MKIFRRVLSFFIAVTMLTAMIPNALAENSKVYTIQNDYVKYTINSETGGFSVETLDGNPQKELDNNIPLLYKEDESRSNGTSFTTIRIDGKDYIFGRSYGFFGINTVLSTPVISEGGRLITVDWKIKDYTVTQQVALSAENDNDLTGNVGISYTVKNNGSSSAPVGIRVLLDSALGSTVDSPYLIKDTDAMPIEVETEFSGAAIPDQIRGVDSLSSPTKMCYTFLKGWNTDAEMDRVVVGHWRNLANTRYDYTPDGYCNFTNYSNKYKFPDSAIAYYWNEAALAPGSEKTAQLLYGVGNFSSDTTDENLGVNMSIDNKIRLNDNGDGYVNDGNFEVTVELDNTVDGAQYIEEPIITLDLEDGIELQTGESAVKNYEKMEPGKIYTVKYKLKAKPQMQITSKSIAVSVQGTQTIDENKAKEVNYGTSRSVLLPSVSGLKPNVSINSIDPEIVYTEGTKTITVSGEISALQSLKGTDLWELYLVHTTNGSKVRIDKDKIAFTDNTYSVLTFSTDEKLTVGEYKLTFEFTDTQLVQQFKVTSITAAKKLSVSNDPKYRLRSYGLMALVRHDKKKYSFVPFNDESEYNSFLAGNAFNDTEGNSVKVHNHAEYKENELANDEVILIIRGDIRESEINEGGGKIKKYYQADPEDAPIIINDILTYTGKEPLIINKMDDKQFKVSGNGKLSVVDSIAVWRGEWFFQTVDDIVTTLDPGSYGGADCTQLQLQLDGLGHVVQSIGGFLIDITYGVMSASRLSSNDRTMVYGIGFGGKISIPIKNPESKSKKDTAKEAAKGDGGYLDEDYSDVMTSMFDEGEPTQSGTKKLTKDTVLDEGGLTANVEEVRFGQRTKDDKIEDVGFVGINTTLSLCLPKDVLGNLVSNAPGVYASMTINTIDGVYALGAGLDIMAIQCEGVLSFQKVEIKDVDVILPDNIEFYIREGLQIPIVPPFLTMTGLGGGINDLAETMGGEFTKLPPMTILLFTRLKAVEAFIGDFDASVNLMSISLNGEMKIDTKGLIPSPVVINAGISARWVDPICFRVYGQINVIDGLIKGGVTITITDKSFCGYAFVAICIPDSIPIIGGKELAKVDAAISTDYIGASIKIIGIKYGIIYYWDGNLALGKDVSLMSFDDEVDPSNMDALTETDMDDGETHALYGTNIRRITGTPVNNGGAMLMSGEASLMSAGTTVTYNFNVSGEDAAVFEIPYEGYVIPTTADVTLTNPDGTEIDLVDADDEGNGNFMVQTRDDGNFMYISVTDNAKLKNGEWKVTIYNNDITVNSFGCYAADNIAELNGVTAAYSSTEPYKVNVSWTTDCEADNAGYLDVYLTKDKDIMSKVQTSDADTVIGEHIGRVRLDTLKSGNQEFTIPDSLAGGDYYAVATLSDDQGGMSTAITTSSFKFTNSKLPKAVKSAEAIYGGDGDIYVKIEDADNADYTHYIVSIVAEDGTTLSNNVNNFKKGEKVFIGSDANLEAGKKYYVQVQTLTSEGGTKLYYGDDIVKTNTITMPEISKPKLVSVETNITGEYTTENTFEATYTFDKPVLLLCDINGDTVTGEKTGEGYYQTEWKVSYPLVDGDYTVNFEAIGENKDSVSGYELKDTVENALMGFKVDTVEPTLALKQNALEILEKGKDGVKTRFGANVVIADDNGDFVVNGISELNAELTVDGQTDGLTTNADGTFAYKANLGNAQQRLMEFKAVDKAGNTSTLIVNAITKKQSSIKTIEILNDGAAVTKNADGEAVIKLKKNQTANLTVRGITEDGETFDIENSEILWDVLYEKNLIVLENGRVVPVGTGETAIKAGIATGQVTLLNSTQDDISDDTIVDTAIEYYVIITITYSKEDLAAEIANAESNILVTGNAEADDVAAYQAAIGAAKAVYNDDSASDADVENAVDKLRKATEAFNNAKNKRIDKTALAAEISSAESNIAVPGNASTDDVAAYRSAIDAAEAIYDNTAALQTEVDNAVTALRSATNAFNLKKNAGTDKSALTEELTKAKSNIAVPGNASAEDVAAYQSAIDTAEAIYIDPNALQTEVDSAVEDLKSATDAFNAKKNTATDKTALAAEITSAESNIAVPGNASADDVTTYQSAIDAAKAVRDNTAALQTEVDSAVTALKNATNAFNLKKNAGTDKTALAAEIASAESNIAVPGNASADDVAAYRSAIDAAKAVYDNTAALQTEVDSTVETLKAATNAFNLKKNAGVDKSVLAEELTKAKSNIAVPGNASAEDVAAYQITIDAAEAIYVNPNATQAEVDSAVETLKAATDAFNAKKNVEPDKTALAAEIAKAESNIANIKKASEDDVKTYQTAIDAAKAIYEKIAATQTEVDKAVSDLKSATSAFDKKNNPSSSSGGGGGSSKKPITYYTVSVSTGEGGNASVSQEKVASGNSVTITSVPEEGYEIDAITVNGAYFGNEEIMTIASVNEDTNISVTFIKKWTNPFGDVANSDWFYNNVRWANSNGLMNGTKEDTFSPQDNVTRAMLVTILYRMEGEPPVSGSCSFNDVDSSAYYRKAVVWAQSNGIVNGYTDTEFAPQEPVLREQIAAILYRYASYKGCDVNTNADVTSYNDCGSISEYALEAVKWTVGAGIIGGKDDKTIAPTDNATRAEVAAMMQRFEENIK